MAAFPKARLGRYPQKTVRGRLEAFFLANVGKVATSDQILRVARDPKTKRNPENWHQRISELRTDYGYNILTSRDRSDLKRSEYLLLTAQRRPAAGKRVKLTSAAWRAILERAGNACEGTRAVCDAGSITGTSIPSAAGLSV